MRNKALLQCGMYRYVLLNVFRSTQGNEEWVFASVSDARDKFSDILSIFGIGEWACVAKRSCLHINGISTRRSVCINSIEETEQFQSIF